MSRNYFSLPQFQPGDMRINTAPVQNALEAYGAKTERFGQVQRQQEEQTYQRGRESKQDARQDEQFQMQRQEALGKRMYAFSQLPPERRDPRVWQTLVQEHQKYNPGDGMDPDDLDPVAGPNKFGASYAAAFGGVAQDPMDAKMKQAELAYKQAQTSKLYADAKEGTADFGKTGTIVRGADGNLYSVRYRADGTEQINPLQVGGQTVQQDRGTDVVGDVLIDKSTGSEIRNVGGNIAAGEQKKVEGREMGERKMAVPKARASLRALETQHRNVLNTIERAKPQITKWTTGLAGQALSSLGGTDANDLRVLLNTVKANLGFDKLQDMRDNSPTGGALGQVAVAELEMLQSAFASVEQSQTPEQLADNIAYLTDLLKEMQGNRRMAFDETYGAENRPPVPQSNDPKAALKQKYGVDLE